MTHEQNNPKCQWRGCDLPSMAGRRLCERHSSDNPKRFKPKIAPTLEAASALLASDRKAKRKQGMEMLCQLHADELILAHALNETDSNILNIASEALYHHPPELIRHLLTQPSAYFAKLYMRFHIARDNHLYAEETIRGVYAARRTLTLDAIEAIGFSYLRSLADLLRKYITTPLELYADALQSKGPKAVAGVEGLATDGWSRAGWAAIQSTIALTRLDYECDLREIERLLQEAENTQRQLRHLTSLTDERRGRINRSILGTRAYLEWALFDKGARRDHEKIVAFVREGTIEILSDLATTLLKHREERELERLAGEFPLSFFTRGEFCYWPLMNWLESSGILAKNQFGMRTNGQSGSLTRFWLARENGTAPPLWWQWR